MVEDEIEQFKGMSRGVIGNTSVFGTEEYRFETCRDNN